MLHALKTLPPYFEDILEGRKTFEVRKHDRPFNEDDDIVLQEFTKEGQYTEREWHGKITYILSDSEFCKKGFCILGIKEKSKPAQVGNIQPSFGDIRPTKEQ